MLLLTTACAPAGTKPGAPAAKVPLTSAPIDAALVTEAFGWVLTATELFVTVDSGRTFQRPNDLPTGPARAAFFRDASHGWVAAAEGVGVSVARTSDGGTSWQVATFQAKEPVSALGVAFADASNGVLLARVQSGGAFSFATLYATTDGGVSWAARDAPVAGRVAVEPDGRIWLAGGVRHDELYTSRDQGRSWSRPALELASPAQVESVTTPDNGVLSVTAVASGSSRVALLTSADGGTTWRETGSAPLSTDTAAAVPVAAPGNAVLVVDPAGERLYRSSRSAAALASTSEVRSAGLPAGALRATFATASTGWVLASAGSCAKGKQDCAINYHVVSTVDGGATWQELLSWREPVG
jgi:photosystem II stability/assembly factor-like uncharacterized protein